MLLSLSTRLSLHAHNCYIINPIVLTYHSMHIIVLLLILLIKPIIACTSFLIRSKYYIGDLYVYECKTYNTIAIYLYTNVVTKPHRCPTHNLTCK